MTLVNGEDSLVLHLFGATVTSWRTGGEEVLFVSKESRFDNKTPIRGGIPIVFPQFGPWPLGPNHGFARSSMWTVKEPPAKTEDGNHTVLLTLEDSDHTRSMWNHKFQLSYRVTLKKSELLLSLSVVNKGDSKFDFTTLLHPYWSVPDVRNCKLSGCSGTTYIDKTKNCVECREEREHVSVTEWTDNVYKDTENVHRLSGLSGSKTLVIEKKNFPDTVVWNPWSKIAEELKDFGSDEYPRMLCVEPGHVSRPVHLEPGQRFESSCAFRVVA